MEEARHVRYAREEPRRQMVTAPRWSREFTRVSSIAFVNPEVSTDIGLDRNQAVAQVHASAHRRDIVRTGAKRLTDFLDDIGVLRGAGRRMWRSSGLRWPDLLPLPERPTTLPGMAPDAPTRAYRRLSVEERRSQLLDAALELFAHRAPAEVSLDDVAEAAGVSRPLVYRYFPGGKQQLYEAALRSAADELEHCFDEPPEGSLTSRLSRALDRYLAFVDGHDAGFSALLQGGSVVETSRATAIVDGVRRAAAEHILRHMEVAEPGLRLRMTVRMWITSVEAASLIWLDEGKQPDVGELRDWLVEQFSACLLATAARDAQTADVVRRALALETLDGAVAALARAVLPVVGGTARLL